MLHFLHLRFVTLLQEDLSQLAELVGEDCHPSQDGSCHYETPFPCDGRDIAETHGRQGREPEVQGCEEVWKLWIHIVFRCIDGPSGNVEQGKNRKHDTRDLQQNRCDIGFVDAQPLRQNEETIVVCQKALQSEDPQQSESSNQRRSLWEVSYGDQDGQEGNDIDDHERLQDVGWT